MHALASSLRSISRCLHDLFIENVNLLLAVLLICAIGTLLLQLPAPSTIFAQGGEEESGDAGAVFFIRNPGFEQQTNGNHFVPWECTLEVPVGTTVFRVKLKSDAPDPQSV